MKSDDAGTFTQDDGSTALGTNAEGPCVRHGEMAGARPLASRTAVMD